MMNNNIGMNPMGMVNPMGMMNPMGMNNQPNLMNGMNFDETALNIKKIIEPYENKIRELEEIIKQKDFEITVLKQKLNTSNNNNMNNKSNINQINMMNMNPMMMNINPMMMNMELMNMMMGNMNNINQPIKKEITVYVKLENNKTISVKCSEDDITSIIKKKCKISKGHLSLNHKMIYGNSSIKENGITDYSEINEVSDCFNVIFKTDIGRNLIIPLDENCPVGISIIYFFIRTNISEIVKVFDDKIRFLYNDTFLRINDNTPIKKIFINNPNPRVYVKD